MISAFLQDVEGRIPIATVRQLWSDAERLTGDPDIGLSVGEKGPLGTGVIAYAVQTSPTFGAGIRTVCRFHRLVTDVGSVTLTIDGARASMALHTGANSHDWLPRHISELYLAKWVCGGRQLTGVDWDPIAVRFRHPQPASTLAHERLFRAPLFFDHATDEIEFDAALLELPLVTHDPALAAILERYGEELLSRLPRVDDFTDAVREAVARSLRSQDSTLEGLATRFHMTPRTLQRRLAAHGISLRTLIDDVRRQHALTHVTRADLPIAEIAFLLGFDAVTSFHRAFRRWTGVTPVEYRQGRAKTSGAPAK